MGVKQAGVFQGHKYINLETFRKSGVAVRTPVWFAQDGDRLYVWTDGTSGKAKRIRHSAQVKIAPSDARGTGLGEWVSGEARVYTKGTPAYERGSQLINRKYGLMKRLFDLMGRFRRDSGETVVIEIALCD